ncbi:hypothetical protein WA538_006125, partial [Blastocystis sp. DL]
MPERENRIDILSDLREPNVDPPTLLVRIKKAFDYMYLLNQPSQLMELLDLVLQILQRVPVSLKNDCNHQIRSYCYQLFNKMLRKGAIDRDAKARMLRTAFQCFFVENEINGTILVRTIDMLLMTCDVVSKEDADMYLTRMEESYLHFDKAAEVFVHESPTLLLEERESSSANAFSVQLDNQVSSSCSSQMASACMAQKGVAASSMRDGHASSVSFHTSLPTSQNGIAPSSQIGATAPPPLPTVSTGPTRARSRSYSVDLVTRPSSSLNPDRSDQITDAPIAPARNSILHLHRGLSVVLRLLRHFRDLAQRHK